MYFATSLNHHGGAHMFCSAAPTVFALGLLASKSDAEEAHFILFVND